MARLLKASDVQPDDDAALILASRRESRIRAAIEDMLAALAAIFTGDAIAQLIARYDIPSLWDILDQPELQAIIIGGFKPIGETFLTAANDEAEAKFGSLIVYDPLATAAPLTAIRQQFQDAILGQAKAVIQARILESLRYGISPDAVAESLSYVIGLTPRQAQAVMNFRSMLESGDSDVLTRALRDRRFDSTVRAMIAGDIERDAAKIDAMVERYAERMVAYRATTIARTEAMQAATGGIRDAYLQAVNSGRLFDHEVRRRWLTAEDELVCPICSSIPLLNGDGVGIDEPYDSIDGPIMAPLAHTSCCCSESYAADLTRLTEQPFAQAA